MSQAKDRDNAIAATIAVHAAIRNIHLYPLSSPSVIVAIDKAYQSLVLAMKTDRAFSIQEAEKRLVVRGEPLPDAEQQRPQLSGCLDLLIQFGIRQLTFRKGIQRSEFADFLEVFSAATKEAAIGGEGVPVIAIDEAAFPNVTLRQRTPSLQGAMVEPTDPADLMFTSFGVAVSILDFLLPENGRRDVARRLGTGLLAQGDEVVAAALAQRMEGTFGAMLIGEIVESLDEERFETLIFRIRALYQNQAEKHPEERVHDAAAMKQAFERLITTEKGVRVQKRIRGRRMEEQEKKRQHTLNTLLGISDILNGKLRAFQNEQLMSFLPDAVRRLAQGDQQKVAENLIAKLGEALVSRHQKIRLLSSQALAKIIGDTPAQDRADVVEKITERLTAWFRFETEITPVYAQLAGHLKDLAQRRIGDGQYDACAPILEAFNAVYYAKGMGGERKRQIAHQMLRHISTDTVLTVLLSELRSGEPERRRQVVSLLTRMGAMSVPSILTLLKESENRNERARLLNALSDIGAPALNELILQIQAKDQPWYYIRNLLLLFGKMGTAAHADIIAPFLVFPDLRVQREAINTLNAIGGKRREAIFLAALPSVEPDAQTELIRLLGRMKSRNAVDPFLSMIDPETFKPSKETNRVAESICRALAEIGDGRAVPVLKRIIEQKKLVLSPGGGALQTAASGALSAIQTGPGGFSAPELGGNPV